MMHEVLTHAERSLTQTGRAEAVDEMRLLCQETMAADFRDVVERVTGGPCSRSGRAGHPMAGYHGHRTGKVRMEPCAHSATVNGRRRARPGWRRRNIRTISALGCNALAPARLTGPARGASMSCRCRAQRAGSSTQLTGADL
jgi:hypothetical protein